MRKLLFSNRRFKRYHLSIILVVALAIIASQSDAIIITTFSENEEVINTVKEIFYGRSKAIINGDLDLIKSMYDTGTKYGTWAYEYEVRKVKYIHNWEKKQGVKLIDITPTVVVRRVKENGDKYTINLLCSTEYKYVYEDEKDVVNSCRIGTYHIMDIAERDDQWIITREWYKDPFADSLNLGKINVEAVKDYILSQGSRNISDINERRIKAVEYADKYCGAASDGQNDYKYNKKYRNYNPQGGDCANFASQILHEGGGFRKTSRWGYDSGGATRAWVNAGGFKEYMLSSGRASLIAYGSYEKVYKASYKLLPGDFIAYEKKGDITHISVVTGVDSRGYSLVSCHNTDRNRVPWDLGWSNSSIRFWLIRVHY